MEQPRSARRGRGKTKKRKKKTKIRNLMEMKGERAELLSPSTRRQTGSGRKPSPGCTASPPRPLLAEYCIPEELLKELSLLFVYASNSRKTGLTGTFIGSSVEQRAFHRVRSRVAASTCLCLLTRLKRSSIGPLFTASS